MGPAGPIAAGPAPRLGPLPQVTAIACNPAVGLRVSGPSATMGRKAALKSISNEAPYPANYRHVLCATARRHGGGRTPTGSVAIVLMSAWGEYRWELACQR